jgi:hypothetical protein
VQLGSEHKRRLYVKEEFKERKFYEGRLQRLKKGRNFASRFQSGNLLK